MLSQDRASRVLAFAIACVLLLAPALWNGFPLLQWDTGGYLARPFEGYLVPSRSTVYGLFIAAGIPFNFWLVIVIQAAATIWVIGLMMRVYGTIYSAFAPLAITAFLCVLTTLPWITAILITDIFTGLSVLALHLLLFAEAKMGRPERAGLFFLVAFAASTHSATLAVLLGLTLVAAMLRLLGRTEVPVAGIVRNAAALAAGAVMLLTANFALSGRVAWTPGGYGIVFGRMLQDGIVARYLEDHCPDPRLRLCPYRTELPRDADMFLWGPDKSVFNRLGRFTGLGDEMRLIVLESLAAYPWLQIKMAFIDTLKQLVSVRSGEGVLPSVWHTYGIIERFTPSVLPAAQAARQYRGEIGFDTLNVVHVPVALASTALIPVLAWLGWRRRRFDDVGRLAKTVTVALVGNAAVCGVLSDPHDRYGARIAWIATFVLLIAGIRFLRGAHKAAD